MSGYWIWSEKAIHRLHRLKTKSVDGFLEQVEGHTDVRSDGA